MWFCIICVFFFKQKTAYEMRISDWSSDVCSSDLTSCRSGFSRSSSCRTDDTVFHPARRQPAIPATGAVASAHLPPKDTAMRLAHRLSPLLLALLAAPLSVVAQDAAPAQRPEVAAAAQQLQQQVVDWRRDFHAHPELSNREERTAGKVAEHLRALGLEPRTGIAHHGVTAIIRGGKPGPKIALRADMDALPVTERNDLPFASKVTTTFNGQQTGVMHACGHDAHTAILLGVADALVAMRGELPGEVMLVFQPSEEGAPEGEEGGGSMMLEEGLFAD